MKYLIATNMEKKLQVLYVLKGLPASGKSTAARQITNNIINTVRVNRDDIRNMLTPNFKFGGKMEKLVTDIENTTIEQGLLRGYDVIVDATNFKFNPYRWTLLAIELGFDLRVVDIFIDTPLEECIERDSKREKPVGEQVIRNFYNKYLKDK